MICKKAELKQKRSVIGPARIDGGISRVRELPDGSAVIESWKPGVGWVEGGASLDEFIPGACTPVSEELAARMGIAESELDPNDVKGWPSRVPRKNPR